MAKRILIVDDEPDICEILRFNLEMDGYEVYTAEGAEEGQQLLNEKPVDLIILDVMMASKSGFEWAKELKADVRTIDVPIIFCTAKTMENDLLNGFAIGSDDYICKPFRISEVKARVKAVLRRSQQVSGSNRERRQQDNDMSNTIQYEGILLHLDRKECFIDGQEVMFTKIEFEILSLLLSKSGQVFSRERILQTVWPSDTIVLDRTVDVNITRIRKKIGRYGECLRTKFGYGYMFCK